jgi:DNA-directed RNA polymerase specialized sigma24 family protein
MVLSEIQGLTAPEIAAIIDIPEATVRTRLFHARRDFARLCRRHPDLAELFQGGAS